VVVLALGLVLFPLGLMAAPYADCVIDARTGEVLRATNADARLHPASLTKMMTLYIAFEAIEHGEISLDSMVTVSKFAASQPPSRLGLRAGQQIALRYLIRAAAVKSANDAAAAIGDAIEGNHQAFAARMNRTAKALGMTRTTFANPNGLTAKGHLSTARDMATLGRRVFYDFPQYYSLFSRRTADAGVAQVSSTNRRFLDSYEGADGIKTGYTAPAGFNLVASAQRGNVRIIAAIFGGTSTAMRNARMAELLDLGFSKAPTRVAVQKPPAIAYMGAMHGKGDLTQLAAVDDAVDPAPAENTSEEPLSDDTKALAMAVAGDVSLEAPAAAKTIRLQTAVSESPVPLLRGDIAANPTSAPEPAPALAPTSDPTEGQAAAATQVAANDPAASSAAVDAAIAADGAAMADATEGLFADMKDTIAQAVQEAQDHPAAPAPEAAVQVAAVAADPATGLSAAPEVQGLAGATPRAPGQSAIPALRTPAVAATAVASADVAPEVAPVAAPVAAAATPAAVEQAVAVADAAAPQDLLAPPPASAEPDVGLLAGVAPLTPDVAPAPEPAAPEKPMIVLASSSAAPAEPQPLEVVTRVSTSGGREWGITVGSFSSRYNAEKRLLQTALVEMESLGDALRKVTPRKGAFDANFVGMTEASAGQACQRLQSRGKECKVIGPQVE